MATLQQHGHAVTRTLEPGTTLFSAAEIRVVSALQIGWAGHNRRTWLQPGVLHPRRRPPAAARLFPQPIEQVVLPVGEAPDAAFQRYASLIVRHRQVELNNVRSFYKEAQKSPFKFFPWKAGNMHFKFLPVRSCCRFSAAAAVEGARTAAAVVAIHAGAYAPAAVIDLKGRTGLRIRPCSWCCATLPAVLSLVLLLLLSRAAAAAACVADLCGCPVLLCHGAAAETEGCCPRCAV